MKINLPAYNGKDNLVMALVVIPVTIIVNLLFFGTQYFSSTGFFVYTTLVTAVIFCLYFILCGLIAVLFKQRFPGETQVLKRLSITILTFLLITVLIMYFLLRGYEAAGLFNISFSEAGFIWSCFAMGITNIFLTFLMEGIARFRDWQTNMRETEKINAAYRQSQLNGLKSQVNPHFLFNSLNSLSSLIQEDEDKAEEFLNEMSKVYRYMLRPDDEQLVTLQTELNFLISYHHLLKARYGEGLLINTVINSADREKLIAPLSLQVIIENAFSENTLSKTSPLFIEITSAGGLIYIKYNKQPRPLTDETDTGGSMENLIKKYNLLGKPIVINDDVKEVRVIFIPLITAKEEVGV